MLSTKITIPHGKDSDVNCSLVGILEQVDQTQSSLDRPLALILHGSMGHKDYLFQRMLALRLPIDSFRFDFRGNHESGGQWSLAQLPNDVEDIQLVAEYMQSAYGYRVTLVIGHSRGSLVGSKWLASGSPESRRVEGFVNISGRYRMEKFHRLYYDEDFKRQGYADWKVRVAGKQVIGRIYPEDVQQFAGWDTSFLHDLFPPEIDVLTIHGLSDNVVPPYDAVIHSHIYGDPKRKGNHALHFVEDADHNFVGHQDEVVETILEWYSMHQNGNLPPSGLWKSTTAHARL